MHGAANWQHNTTGSVHIRGRYIRMVDMDVNRQDVGFPAY